MSFDCINVSDAIWKQISEGGELTEDELQHIRTCSSCADILAEAQLCIDALNCVKPRPAAPDCRSAVLARISNRRVRFAPVLAYACVAIIIIAAVGGMFIRHDSGRQVSRPSAQLAATPDSIPETTPPPPPQPKTQPPVHKPIIRQPSKPPVVHHEVSRKPRKPASFEHKAPPVSVTVPPVTNQLADIPEPTVTPPQDDSSAFAYATWPTRNKPADSYNYSYTVTDPATGEVTRCTVKREGNTVEVNAESDPVEPEVMNGKESKADDTVQYS